MPATVGAPAPIFEMPAYFPETDDARNVSLKDFQGKWVVLTFYPADYTFVCPTELADLAAHHGRIRELGGEVIAVSTDTVYSHRSWRETEKLLAEVRFPMAADNTTQWTQAYGILDEKTGMANRGTFIIDPDGVVKASLVTIEPVGRNAAEIVRMLAALHYVRNNPEASCPAAWTVGLPTVKHDIHDAGRVYEQLARRDAKR